MTEEMTLSNYCASTPAQSCSTYAYYTYIVAYKLESVTSQLSLEMLFNAKKAHITKEKQSNSNNNKLKLKAFLERDGSLLYTFLGNLMHTDDGGPSRQERSSHTRSVFRMRNEHCLHAE